MQLSKSFFVIAATLTALTLPAAHAQNTTPAPASPAATAEGATIKPPTPDVAAPNTTPPVTRNPADEAFQAVIRRNREQNLRDFLVARGVTDKAAQDTIVASVARQEEARNKVRGIGNKLLMALATPAAPDVADAQLKKLTQDYQQALDEFQTLQQQGQQDLEKQLQVSKNVRIQGVLLVLGVTEEAPPLLPAWGVPGTIASTVSH